jgi:hypothetical protein
MLKKHNSFQITDYSVEFRSIFIHKEIEEKFYDFLKTELNTEALDFILEVSRLPLLTPEEQLKQTEYFLDTYLKDNSPKKLNISGELQLETIEKVNNLLISHRRDSISDEPDLLSSDSSSGSSSGSNSNLRNPIFLTETPFEIFSKVNSIVQLELSFDWYLI